MLLKIYIYIRPQLKTLVPSQPLKRVKEEDVEMIVEGGCTVETEEEENEDERVVQEEEHKDHEDDENEDYNVCVEYTGDSILVEGEGKEEGEKVEGAGEQGGGQKIKEKKRRNKANK